MNTWKSGPCPTLSCPDWTTHIHRNSLLNYLLDQSNKWCIHNVRLSSGTASKEIFCLSILWTETAIKQHNQPEPKVHVWCARHGTLRHRLLSLEQTLGSVKALSRLLGSMPFLVLIFTVASHLLRLLQSSLVFGISPLSAVSALCRIPGQQFSSKAPAQALSLNVVSPCLQSVISVGSHIL